MPKDNFSKQSEEYARYRPTYPQELYTYILSFVKDWEAAWDCACGNGQATLPLSDYFTHVFGTDISAKQIAQAARKDNITYVVCPAEETPFSDNQFDLITVAQAYHWLNWEAFEKEARRVGKNKCVIAVWMYDLLVAEEESLNELIRFFIKKLLGLIGTQNVRTLIIIIKMCFSTSSLFLVTGLR
jgi:ubiquinone/menaquinone biosynthesis C-methylase UbiE